MVTEIHEKQWEEQMTRQDRRIELARSVIEDMKSRSHLSASEGSDPADTILTDPGDSYQPSIRAYAMSELSRQPERADEEGFIPYSLIRDPYGAEWIAVEHPRKNQHRIRALASMITGDSTHLFPSRQTQAESGSDISGRSGDGVPSTPHAIVIDFASNARPLTTSLTDLPQYMQAPYSTFVTTKDSEDKDISYLAYDGTTRITEGVASDTGKKVTHVAFTAFPNGKLPERRYRIALFELMSDASKWVDDPTKEVYTKCLFSVGRRGVGDCLIGLFRGFEKDWKSTVPSQCPLEPIQTDNHIVRTVDWFNDFRETLEMPRHFEILEEGLKWRTDMQKRSEAGLVGYDTDNTALNTGSLAVEHPMRRRRCSRLAGQDNYPPVDINKDERNSL